MHQLWKSTPINNNVQKAFRRWNLESPSGPFPQDSDTVKFRGWIVSAGNLQGVSVKAQDGSVYHAKQMLLRPDVAKAFSPTKEEEYFFLKSGFEVDCPSGKHPYVISIVTEGKEIPFATVNVEKEHPFAIEGEDSYLFLSGDSNKSGDQFTGDFLPTERTIAGWKNNFSSIMGWSLKYDINCAFLIAPSKEEVFKDKYPKKRGKSAAIDVFLKAFSNEKVVFPLQNLIAHRSFSYNRTDTHWTDAGAAIAARDLLRFWGLSEETIDSVPDAFSIKTVTGDLGGKCNPKRHDYSLAFNGNFDVVFTNGVDNNGNISVYECEGADIDESCIIFGDSFGENLAKALSRTFRRLIYTYKPASFDVKLVEMMRPKYVVLEITQRFLIGQPSFLKTIFDIAADKINEYPELKKQEVVQSMRAYLDGHLSDLARQSLSALKVEGE